MELSAIRHRPDYCECYAADNDTVVLLLQTGKDIDKAYVICEDPFIDQLYRKEKWYGKRMEMCERLELEHNYLWRVRIRPEYKRLQYYFEVEGCGKSYYVFENRICPVEDKDKRSLQYFKFPWLNPGDVIRVPEFVRNTVWYQIMPDRFCRAKGTNTGERFMPWGESDPDHLRCSYGGNLKGIIERLDYIKSVGVNGIYLNPVFEAVSYHKYNTIDYTKIDPDFGTNDDMKELVKEAHARGIKVMLDGVFNHSGIKFRPWTDVLEKGKDSQYYSWFFINTDDFRKGMESTGDGRYYSFSFSPSMPKLNTNNDEVIRYFTDICLTWVREWDIDGIRFDVGDEVSHRFMAALHRALKAEKPDLFMLGEIWFDSIAWLNGTEYDSVMNYPLSNCLNDFFEHEDMTARELMYNINSCFTMYPEQVTSGLFNFLDTHDTVRAFESCGGSTDILLQRLALLLFLPGTPCLYYGTELALKGINKDDNRQCMPWDRIDSGYHKEFFAEVQKLIGLRGSDPLFTALSVNVLPDDQLPRLIHITKEENDRLIGIVINAGSSPVKQEQGYEILYSNACEGSTLLPGGTLIYRQTR